LLPRITIITPSFQQAEYLEECLESVHAQGYPDLEHIVVDGGSTDGSKAIIERYADKLAWWCSEPDGGQSAAINKGLERATGQVFGWLNSDDLLLPGALHHVGRWFSEDPGAWAHRGRLELTEGCITQEFPGAVVPHDQHSLYHDPLVVQQSTFYRMDAVRALGGVEAGLHHVMDLELQWQLLFRVGEAGLVSHEPVLAVFRQHAGSKTAQHRDRFLDEQATLLHTMLTATGQADLAGVLALGRTLVSGLREVPVSRQQAWLVRGMALHFLLKWDHVIMHEAQFQRMRALRRSIALAAEPLSHLERSWIAALEPQLNVPNWAAFRLKRKWAHLRGRS
jgi:hypothetical protein